VQEEAGPFVVNRTRLFIREPLAELKIDIKFRVEVSEPSLIAGMYGTKDLVSGGPTVAQLRDRAARNLDLKPMGPASYLYPAPMTPSSPAIAAWAARFFPSQQGVLAAGQALMHAIYEEFTYDGEATTSATLPDEAFAERHGVCQDFAHVMIVAARAHGIPAAYVSGYLRTLPPPGKARLVGANDTLARSDHIFTAMGRDYSDVSPLDGVFHGGAAQKLSVSVDVAPCES